MPGLGGRKGRRARWIHTLERPWLSLKVVAPTGPAAGQCDHLLRRIKNATERQVTGDSRASTQCYSLTYLGSAGPWAKKWNPRQQWDVCCNQLSCSLPTQVWTQVLSSSNTSAYPRSHTTHNNNTAARETGIQPLNPSAWKAEAGEPLLCSRPASAP